MPFSTAQHASSFCGARGGELISFKLCDLAQLSCRCHVLAALLACHKAMCTALCSLQLPPWTLSCAGRHASRLHIQKDKHLYTLQAYAHATLGRWLHRQGLLQARSCVSSSDQEQDSAARQLHKSRYILAGHPALVHWFGKLALSYGVLLVVLVVSLKCCSHATSLCLR